MINFIIEVQEGRYFISEFHKKNGKKEIPPRYIKRFMYIFGDLGRLPRLGKVFEYLVDTDKEIAISEYDLLQMIRILYTHKYNLSAGKWLIEYYQEVYEYAYFELSKILPD